MQPLALAPRTQLPGRVRESTTRAGVQEWRIGNDLVVRVAPEGERFRVHNVGTGCASLHPHASAARLLAHRIVRMLLA
jgi:hypothetical protein